VRAGDGRHLSLGTSVQLPRLLSSRNCNVNEFSRDLTLAER